MSSTATHAQGCDPEHPCDPPPINPVETVKDAVNQAVGIAQACLNGAAACPVPPPDPGPVYQLVAQVYGTALACLNGAPGCPAPPPDPSPVYNAVNQVVSIAEACLGGAPECPVRPPSLGACSPYTFVIYGGTNADFPPREGPWWPGDPCGSGNPTYWMSFYVYRVGELTTPATVNYFTQDITATAGADYLPASGSLTFQPLESSKGVYVPICGDSIVENPETFWLILQGTGTQPPITNKLAVITDDDLPPAARTNPLITVDAERSSRETREGGGLYFAVKCLSSQRQAISFGYRTLNGTASANLDYVPTSGTGNVLCSADPFSLWYPVAVTTKTDALVEGAETLFLEITNVPAGTSIHYGNAAVIVD